MSSLLRTVTFLAMVLAGCAAPAAAQPADRHPPASSAGSAGSDSRSDPGEFTVATRWGWPTTRHVVVRAYVAPTHEYGPGHRGVDLSASVGEPLRAPADGVVLFSGVVVDREVLTIDHGGGWITTLEPVTDAVLPGTPVRRGDEIARVGDGGHTVEAVHFGVRRDGAYVNPLLLLGDVPRAVLLPCCADADEG